MSNEISREIAYKTAKDLVGDNDMVKVFDEKDYFHPIYLPNNQDPYWVCEISNKHRMPNISSSEVILISKKVVKLFITEWLKMRGNSFVAN